jgi:phage-related protein
VSTFTWAPDYDAEGEEEPKVAAIKFGDGYEQRAQVGVNVLQERWPLVFGYREQDETEEILDFFREHGGVTAFDWTAPGDTEAKKWVCRLWRRRINRGGRFTITATFERTYDV